MKINDEILNELIVGYVPHKIYAFSTPQAENYLKVGETSRSVSVRLDEWKTKIADLNLEREWFAMLPKSAREQKSFFQDFALHKYFEDNGFSRLPTSQAPGNSKEFFPVTLDTIEAGIDTINSDYLSEPPHNYTYLNIADNSRTEEHWARTKDFSMRENQKDVICNILAAKNDEGVEPNYLLFAVMRFGKTFVALQAAKALDSKLTVVVSAKADVKNEWKENLESHRDFEGYVFLDSSHLRDSKALEDTLKESRVVLFLTLQDLKGSSVKERHKQLFEKQINLLIIDESHFGARAQSYGQKIQFTYDDENADEEKALKNIETLKVTCKLHLSGTPYRILMGDEFSNPKQIVGKVQFEDILQEKENWFKNNPDKQEWKNPYFGFPQMIRFAFNLSESAKRKVKDLEGASTQLNEIFGTLSTKKDDENNYLEFKHSDYVLETLKSLDGANDSDTIFPILNYPNLKNGKMARHIVMVLPFRTSCDAMAKMLADKKESFINLKDYEVINIAGVDSTKTVEQTKNAIKEAALADKKTISLTVNKMLTGVTVPQWDTMIYLKDTQSPQEYDQAIYRLQSPYVTAQVDEKNTVINKEDLKPQTLLIDFSPNRMMSLEQYKAFILSASDGESGNDKVKKSLARQMTCSPIITIDNQKLTEVKPADVLKYVAAYSSEKGMAEEASEIAVDLSILKNNLLFNAINAENEIKAKTGLKFDNTENGEDTTNEEDIGGDNGEGFGGDDHSPDNKKPNEPETKDERNSLTKKMQNYYLRILFYAFLSKETKVDNLSDVILTYDNNERLARHLGLRKDVLEAIKEDLRNPWVCSELDNKISNANSLLVDDSLPPEEKVARAIRSFGRISESEVFTPKNVADMMAETVIENMNLSNYTGDPQTFIDIASKSGIYLLCVYQKLIENGCSADIVKNNLFAVTTSTVAYEFTRKVYELMCWDLENLIEPELATSYDLIDSDKNAMDEIEKYYKSKRGENINMKFDIVVGNPPYQEEANGENNQATPIYNLFYDLADSISSKYSLISPARFLSNQGATPKEWNRRMLNNEHLTIEYFNAKSNEVFPNTDIKGGVVVIYHDKDKHFGSIDTFIPYDELRSIYRKVKTITQDNISDFVYSPDSYRFTNELFTGNPILVGRTDNAHAKAVASSVFERYKEVFFDAKPKDGQAYVQIYGRLNGERIYKYIKRAYLAPHPNLDKWKVFVPGATGTGAMGEVLSMPIIGQPKIGHTQTFVSLGKFDTEIEATALYNYIKSKFGRAMLGIMKTTQNNQSKNTWSKIPLQDFTASSDIDWTKSIQEIDRQLYKKYDLNEKEIAFIEEKVKAME